MGNAFVLTVLLLGAPGFAQGTAPATAKAAELRKVDSDKVCMVNNKFMGSPQIPVPHENKTYYGCCQMCVERIQKDATFRTAVDPVSGKQVDKAKAVIGADAANDVLYFESEANLKKYAKR